VGWLDEAAGDALLGAARGASRAVHWNRDVVLDLPSGAQVTARSADGAVQAARLGRWVWGVQSHPEVDESIVRTWAEEEWDHADDAHRRLMSDLVRRVAAGQDALIESWRPLATGFAALVGQTGGSR
jgi:GMP synthase (glutamine-hydrolysing)